MDFNPADLDLATCEKQHEEAKARLEAAQAFQQKANDLALQSRIDEIRAVLSDRDGCMREQQEERIRLRDQLADLHKKQAAMKAKKTDLERRGRERQMQYQLDEIALKMADSEKLSEQQAEISELIRTKETHIRACDEIIARNMAHASSTVTDVIHQTTLLDEALSSNIIDARAPIKSLADDVHAHLSLERKERAIAQNKHIMNLQQERAQVEEQLTACTARRRDADFVLNKGPDFLVALHEGAVSPLKDAHTNAPPPEDADGCCLSGSAPGFNKVIPVGDMNVLVKDAQHVLDSGHARMHELTSQLGDLERELQQLLPPDEALDTDVGQESAPSVVQWIREIVEEMGSNAVTLAFKEGGRPQNVVEEQQGMYVSTATTSVLQFRVAHDTCYAIIPLMDELIREVCGDMARAVTGEVLRYADEVKGMIRHVFALASMRRTAGRRGIAADQEAMATTKGRKAAAKNTTIKMDGLQQDGKWPKIASKKNEEKNATVLNSAFRQMFDDACQMKRRKEDRASERVAVNEFEEALDCDEKDVIRVKHLPFYRFLSSKAFLPQDMGQRGPFVDPRSHPSWRLEKENTVITREDIQKITLNPQWGNINVLEVSVSQAGVTCIVGAQRKLGVYFMPKNDRAVKFTTISSNMCSGNPQQPVISKTASGDRERFARPANVDEKTEKETSEKRAEEKKGQNDEQTEQPEVGGSIGKTTASSTSGGANESKKTASGDGKDPASIRGKVVETSADEDEKPGRGDGKEPATISSESDEANVGKEKKMKDADALEPATISGETKEASANENKKTERKNDKEPATISGEAEETSANEGKRPGSRDGKEPSSIRDKAEETSASLTISNNSSLSHACGAEEIGESPGHKVTSAGMVSFAPIVLSRTVDCVNCVAASVSPDGSRVGAIDDAGFHVLALSDTIYQVVQITADHLMREGDESNGSLTQCCFTRPLGVGLCWPPIIALSTGIVVKCNLTPTCAAIGTDTMLGSRAPLPAVAFSSAAATPIVTTTKEARKIKNRKLPAAHAKHIPAMPSSSQKWHSTPKEYCLQHTHRVLFVAPYHSCSVSGCCFVSACAEFLCWWDVAEANTQTGYGSCRPVKMRKMDLCDYVLPLSNVVLSHGHSRASADDTGKHVCPCVWTPTRAYYVEDSGDLRVACCVDTFSERSTTVARYPIIGEKDPLAREPPESHAEEDFVRVPMLTARTARRVPGEVVMVTSNARGCMAVLYKLSTYGHRVIVATKDEIPKVKIGLPSTKTDPSIALGSNCPRPILWVAAETALYGISTNTGQVLFEDNMHAPITRIRVISSGWGNADIVVMLIRQGELMISFVRYSKRPRRTQPGQFFF